MVLIFRPQGLFGEALAKEAGIGHVLRDRRREPRRAGEDHPLAPRDQDRARSSAAPDVFMAVVGILMMFQNRPIIVDILTLGYATLGLTLFAAGLLVARRGLFGHR